MAWRIHDHVIRGEIDNRRKGKVLGKIWIHGMKEPVVLNLIGNAFPDLAGCLLVFTNKSSSKPIPHSPPLATEQRGHIGDLTASRKVRVFDVPPEEAYMMIKRGEKPSEHMANSLYLEWYSERNGRVLVESADYQLQISAPEWRMSPEDEAERATDSAVGWKGFLAQLQESIDSQRRQAKDPEAEWDEHDYERLMKEADARADRFRELIDKYGDAEEAFRHLAEELGSNSESNPDNPSSRLIGLSIENLTDDEDWKGCLETTEPLPEPEPHREGIDWIRTESGEIRHPVQHRAFETALRYHRMGMELALDTLDDDDLDRFLAEFLTTAAKLGGALEGIANGTDEPDGPLTVACLKRALQHLHQALAGLEGAAGKTHPNKDQPLLPAPIVKTARNDLHQIREDILRLMDHYRSAG